MCRSMFNRSRALSADKNPSKSTFPLLAGAVAFDVSMGLGATLVAVRSGMGCFFSGRVLAGRCDDTHETEPSAPPAQFAACSREATRGQRARLCEANNFQQPLYADERKPSNEASLSIRWHREAICAIAHFTPRQLRRCATGQERNLHRRALNPHANRRTPHGQIAAN